MKYDTFRDESLGQRWEWETTQSIQLCLMDGYTRSLKADILNSIDSIVAEFKLPLRSQVANPDAIDLIEGLLTKASTDGAVCCWRFLEALNRRRYEGNSLQTGLIIAFAGRQRTLRDESSNKPDEPPQWGWTIDDGLILLRLVPSQPLRNLVRHEMGHLLGIGQHHPNCVMAWACTEEEFCGECKQTISRTCQLANVGDPPMN